ncbi:hypothetical protein RJ639_033579 [Escallonia herrerae]|uniref:DELLA protein RGL1-like n=1 Tax=Escallonia herrerae TaxID=1293975 RepID=A0AA88WX77_9ASTE|nr:hypothetical protein RJ639_033579 [Escallonia herrerae]
MKDLKEDLFNIEAHEAVVVYSPTILRTMISRPDCLESLMTVIRGLKPSVMVVMEVEANHNSPSFVNRFIEALVFYSAFFDSLEDCMDRGNRYRMEFEGGHIRNGIQNMVATEGEERISRSVKLNKWRAFFARFGMVEFELSKSSLFQADLILKQFSRGSSCTLEDNGKCLIVGWKGTPVHSLSVWKFMIGMMSDPFSLSLDFDDIQTNYTSLEGHEQEDEGIASYSGGIIRFPDQQTILDTWMQNDMQKGMPLQSADEATSFRQLQNPNSDTGECTEDNPYPSSVASSELLGHQEKTSNDTNMSGQSLSTEQILRVATERYIQFSTQQTDGFSSITHPYGSALASLSLEELKDVELARHLLAAAEKVEWKQFDLASRLLCHCELMSSHSGNPIERIVYYFAQALKKRIDRERGHNIITDYKKEYNNGLSSGADLTYLASHKELPFTQVMQFAGMQATIDNVIIATKVHLIDLHIRSGILWTPLLQALAERKNYSIELLKMTAIGTMDKEKIEETGKRLQMFAESLKLPFSFKVVFVSDMKDLKQELFDIGADEAVVVYSPIILRTMISRPDCLESLVRVIRGLKPSLMVVTEVEANHNSPSFVNRFVEALFYISAFFDSLEDCMDRDDQYRTRLEGSIRTGILNMIATEGAERIARSVKLNVWRAFFARFGMVEFGLSKSALYQANVVLKQFSHGSSCTIENNGKCLIVGWKRTPVFSLTVWKFM